MCRNIANFVEKLQMGYFKDMAKLTDGSKLIQDLEDYFAPDNDCVNLEMSFSNLLIGDKYYMSQPEN